MDGNGSVGEGVIHSPRRGAACPACLPSKTPGHSMDSNESHVNQPAGPISFSQNFLSSTLSPSFFLGSTTTFPNTFPTAPTALNLGSRSVAPFRLLSPLQSVFSVRFACCCIVGGTSTSRSEISPVESVRIPGTGATSPGPYIHRLRPQAPNFY